MYDPASIFGLMFGSISGKLRNVLCTDCQNKLSSVSWCAASSSSVRMRSSDSKWSNIACFISITAARFASVRTTAKSTARTMSVSIDPTTTSSTPAMSNSRCATRAALRIADTPDASSRALSTKSSAIKCMFEPSGGMTASRVSTAALSWLATQATIVAEAPAESSSTAGRLPSVAATPMADAAAPGTAKIFHLRSRPMAVNSCS
mmetsp:Transcript_56267/g.163106  ORF Transcript_56267/g.163106 Transcript_56267/m.163106 type:complete len:205 (+) Transcript_56267:1165-1779(+)